MDNWELVIFQIAFLSCKKFNLYYKMWVQFNSPHFTKTMNLLNFYYKMWMQFNSPHSVNLLDFYYKMWVQFNSPHSVKQWIYWILTIKCGCNSIVLIQWNNEFIGFLLSPIQNLVKALDKYNAFCCIKYKFEGKEFFFHVKKIVESLQLISHWFDVWVLVI